MLPALSPLPDPPPRPMLPTGHQRSARWLPRVGDVVRDLREDGYLSPLVVTQVGVCVATLQLRGSEGIRGRAARFFDELEPWAR